jgi:hypothetical protein
MRARPKDLRSPLLGRYVLFIVKTVGNHTQSECLCVSDGFIRVLAI